MARRRQDRGAWALTGERTGDASNRVGIDTALFMAADGVKLEGGSRPSSRPQRQRRFSWRPSLEPGTQAAAARFARAPCLPGATDRLANEPFASSPAASSSAAAASCRLRGGLHAGAAHTGGHRVQLRRFAFRLQHPGSCAAPFQACPGGRCSACLALLAALAPR